MIKVPKLTVGDVVKVVWDDAFVASEYWTTIADLSEIAHIISYGHYLKHTKRYFTISQSSGQGRKNEDEIDGYGGAFSIPIGTIRKITKL